MTTTLEPIGTTSSSTAAAPSNGNSSGSSTYGKEVDDTKAIALPLLLILALLFAIIVTRHSISAAMSASAPSVDFRKFLILAASAMSVLTSVFLMPTASWAYAAINALMSYGMVLSLQPGVLDAPPTADDEANKTTSRVMIIFQVYCAWYAILIGIPDKFLGEGIIATATDRCGEWFTSDAEGGPRKKLCDNSSFMTFAALVAMAIVICQTFVLLGLMSVVFNENAPTNTYQPVGDDGDRGNGPMPMHDVSSQPNIYRSAHD